MYYFDLGSNTEPTALVGFIFHAVCRESRNKKKHDKPRSVFIQIKMNYIKDR